jgi:quinol-cytochrome oxidoreductase complex cytochrome b subunit
MSEHNDGHIPTEASAPGQRRLGSALDTEHADEWGDQPTVRFFPDLFRSEVTAMFLVFTLVTALCIFAPAGLDIVADPSATPPAPKPEWYFLFLNVYLRFVPPIIGTLTPIIATVLLILLPFLDRNHERHPTRRLVAIIFSAVVLVLMAGLTVLGALE